MGQQSLLSLKKPWENHRACLLFLSAEFRYSSGFGNAIGFDIAGKRPGSTVLINSSIEGPFEDCF